MISGIFQEPTFRLILFNSEELKQNLTVIEVITTKERLTQN